MEMKVTSQKNHIPLSIDWDQYIYQSIIGIHSKVFDYVCDTTVVNWSMGKGYVPVHIYTLYRILNSFCFVGLRLAYKTSNENEMSIILSYT